MLPLFFFLLNFASRFTMFDGFDSIHFITKGRWENGELNEKCYMEIFFIKFYFAGKFSLKNTVINVVAGLGLISFITMFCDFILLNYVSERKVVS